MKVGSHWKYLFRPVDKHGRLIDFILMDRRNTRAAHRFLGKALTTMRHWPPSSITTDQLGSYPKAISRLQREGKLSSDTKHRTGKYLNNIIEADHGALKRVIRPMRGFQTMKTATATMKGCEVMRMIRRGHCLTCKPHVKDELRFVNKLFEHLRYRCLMETAQRTNCDQQSQCNRAPFQRRCSRPLVQPDSEPAILSLYPSASGQPVNVGRGSTSQLIILFK